MGSLATALGSLGVFSRLTMGHHLRLRHGRLGRQYSVAGQVYSVFRETVSDKAVGEPVVLVIGFRLRLIRNNRLLHWLFQRACIMTTPFWSGLAGFGIKLWMVSPASKDYLGIYEWHGRSQAAAYVRFLAPILRFFSVGGSVWYESFPGRHLGSYLLHHHAPYTGQADTVGQAV